MAKSNLREVKLERVGLLSSPIAVHDMPGSPLGISPSCVNQSNKRRAKSIMANKNCKLFNSIKIILLPVQEG